MFEQTFNQAVESTSIDTRKSFIKKTYLHTGLAILAFAAVEVALIQSGVAYKFLEIISINQWMWLAVLGLYMVVSIIANKMAMNSTSKSSQYTGLFLFVGIEALIFSPLILIAASFDPGLLQTAGFLTLFMFAGLSLLAFKGGVDWSFLGKFLAIGGFVALGMIVLSLIFGFQLGLWFSGAMILFASGAILYETSNIMHNYNTNQYVAASISLFASVALLFWYILQFLMQMFMGDE